jgi:hypothetical protein
MPTANTMQTIECRFRNVTFVERNDSKMHIDYITDDRKT